MTTKTTKKQLTTKEQNLIIQTAQNYADRFFSFKKQSAEGLLNMGKAVADAKSKHKDVFKKFCDLTNLDASGSTFRKYNAIGQNFDRLMEHVEKLPNNWTTLYKVASLSPSEFQKLVDSKMLNPAIKAATIREVLGAPAPKEQSGNIRVSVSIPKGLNKIDLQSISNALNQLKLKHLVTVNLEKIESEIQSNNVEENSIERLAA
ncbi:hypothetical protein [Flavobacterium sp.]|jgi:hypothetical protein|uniref:hypothetical protein n=1 Tax=Flavobacterium sp. TaxID=239 RepID=UPI0037BE8054